MKTFIVAIVCLAAFLLAVHEAIGFIKDMKKRKKKKDDPKEEQK